MVQNAQSVKVVFSQRVADNIHVEVLGCSTIRLFAQGAERVGRARYRNLQSRKLGIA
jgi:hypothetical protein